MRMNVRLIVAGIALACTFSTVVSAQSTSGNIAGEASAGDTIIVSNTSTGFRREVAIEKDGKFQVRRVPIGEYQVVHVHKGGKIDPAQTVSIRPDATVRIAGSAPNEDQQGSPPGA
ncbi:carboxypeptidase-like regulatory domain-containing protein [Thermomonas sp.]|uniref:carboxypeptidase-like regulatory domain-containing protein n=1 Tax=Thermomonas sp. TaxID=1971895 RepID=UPI0035AE194A